MSGEMRELLSSLDLQPTVDKVEQGVTLDFAQYSLLRDSADAKLYQLLHKVNRNGNLEPATSKASGTCARCRTPACESPTCYKPVAWPCAVCNSTFRTSAWPVRRWKASWPTCRPACAGLWPASTARRDLIALVDDLSECC